MSRTISEILNGVCVGTMSAASSAITGEFALSRGPVSNPFLAYLVHALSQK